jgi:hypothetical protein
MYACILLSFSALWLYSHWKWACNPIECQRSHLSHKGSIWGGPCLLAWKCVRLTICGFLSAVVTAICLPGHSYALYRPPNGCNMCWPQEGTEALVGVENSFAVGRTSNGLTYSYNIDGTVSWQENWPRRYIFTSKNPKESLERSYRKKKKASEHPWFELE